MTAVRALVGLASAVEFFDEISDRDFREDYEIRPICFCFARR